MTELFNNLRSIDVLKEFVHFTINEYLSLPSEDLKLDWTICEIETARDVLSTLFSTCIYENNFEEELLSHISQLGISQQRCILECFKIRKDEIVKQIIKKTNLKNGPVLRNFDWNLRWIIGSSSLASFKETLLSLDLICDERTNNTLTNYNLHLELNKKELDLFIESLEKACDENTTD